MYNADRRSQEFIDGVHSLLRAAEANKRDGFMCCPCAICKNTVEYPCSRTLPSHLFKSGFMPNYICWTKHGETGVVMEEGDGEKTLGEAEKTFILWRKRYIIILGMSPPPPPELPLHRCGSKH